MARDRSKDIQYWLYAVLATRFGRSLRLQRSSIARVYEVNRHDFEAKADYGVPGDRYAFAAEVYKFMVAHLEAAGYRAEKFSGHAKRIEVDGKHYQVCITVRYDPEFYQVKNDTVSLSVSLHKVPAQRIATPA